MARFAARPHPVHRADALRRFRRFLGPGLLLALGLITWWRQPLPPANVEPWLRFVPLALPPAAEMTGLLGPLKFEGAWQLKARNSLFGGYSALVPLEDGRLIAISDRGGALWFRPPASRQARPPRQRVRFQKLQFTMKKSRDLDAEAAARDPATGWIWIATEASNSISRMTPGLGRDARAWPAAMRHWNAYQGPEAMARLPDGRFLVLSEGAQGFFARGRHDAVLFPRDPTLGYPPKRFSFLAPPGELPTELAALPDGRVLVLLRQLGPFGFGGRILLADPAKIRAGGNWTARTLAILAAPLPIDNFEAMTVTPGKDGKLTLWVMSDDNGALFQRSLLLKFAFDPAALEPRRKKARESLRAPPAIPR